MDIRGIPLSEFLAQQGELVEHADIIDSSEGFLAPGTARSFPVLSEHDGYTIRLYYKPEGDVIAVDPAGELAGVYAGETIYVRPQHRLRDLAVGMALWKTELLQVLPIARTLSTGGKSALTAAWRVVNEMRPTPWWSPESGADVSNLPG